jgi:hypothetical protein
MENKVLFELIEKLSFRSKCQVEHLVINLVSEAKEGGSKEFDKFGILIAEDFDAPLKEFHEYMYDIDIEFINKLEKLPLKLQLKLEEEVDQMLLNF